jgi:hypothetical protein
MLLQLMMVLLNHHQEAAPMQLDLLAVLHC